MPLFICPSCNHEWEGMPDNDRTCSWCGRKQCEILEKECNIEKDIPSAQTLYYVLEIFSILNIDVRVNQDQFRHYLGDKKRGPSLIFRFLCLKYLNTESEVKDKEIQFLQQLQKENGSFSFNQFENIDLTFWIVYILELYSWMLDYNPAGIFSFINKVSAALQTATYWHLESKAILTAMSKSASAST